MTGSFSGVPSVSGSVVAWSHFLGQNSYGIERLRLWNEYTSGGVRSYLVADYRNAFHLFFRAWKMSQSRSLPPVAEAISMFNLSLIYRWQGRLNKARRFLLKSLSITSAIFGENHPCACRILDNLADLEMSAGNFRRAREYLVKAEEIEDKSVHGIKSQRRGRRFLRLAYMNFACGDSYNAASNCARFIELTGV